MSKQLLNNTKLGLFVLAGLFVLVISLYMIGRNKSYFGSKFPVKAHFRNINGLMEGNNVRFSGIQAGTVKDIVILSDTVIEVVMLIDKRTRNYIHKNAVVSIGSEGLMGNKIINIEPGLGAAPPVEANDMLVTASAIGLDELMQGLGETGNNASVISDDLRAIVSRVNNNQMIWQLLNDTSLSGNVRRSLLNIEQASAHINETTVMLSAILKGVQRGDGPAGLLLKDTASTHDIRQAITRINDASSQLDGTMQHFNTLLSSVNSNVNNDNGVVAAMFRDSLAAIKVQNSLSNIEKGTEAFSQNMEALKHNFLLRGYFRKQARKAKGQ